MIHFHTTTSEIEELKKTVPNFQLILNALNSHDEIELVIEEVGAQNASGPVDLQAQQ